MHEIVVNLHMHTRYSDGTGLHRDIARAAAEAGIEAVIVTDHNVLVRGVEGYYTFGQRRVLLLVGEEVHDRTRQPQKNHLLVFGVDQEMAPYAQQPQALIDAVRRAGGVCFIAHPVDPAAPAFHEPDISWVDWEVEGYTGLELWNAMSEFKSRLRSWPHALYYAYRFPAVAVGPFPEAVRRWDALLAAGKRVVAVAGSDAHALQARLGPLQRVLFPYAWHFRAVNTHLLLDAPLEGQVAADRQRIYRALAQGRAFLANDWWASARGFRFVAEGRTGRVSMGESLPLDGGVTLKFHLPRRAEVRLVRHGKVVHTWRHDDVGAYTVRQPGAYRLEVYLRTGFRRRVWILSNPIYLTGPEDVPTSRIP